MDVVRDLILKDHHVTLCISGTTIHSILHNKNFFFDPTQFVDRSKNNRSNWSKEMHKKRIRNTLKEYVLRYASKTFKTINLTNTS